jgi:hypothetical protein
MAFIIAIAIAINVKYPVIILLSILPISVNVILAIVANAILAVPAILVAAITLLDKVASSDLPIATVIPFRALAVCVGLDFSTTSIIGNTIRYFPPLFQGTTLR